MGVGGRLHAAVPHGAVCGTAVGDGAGLRAARGGVRCLRRRRPHERRRGGSQRQRADWTNRKKYRQCSTIARAATVKGRKIMKRRMLRGKKKHLNPGDYVNPKMMPVVKLR